MTFDEFREKIEAEKRAARTLEKDWSDHHIDGERCCGACHARGLKDAYENVLRWINTFELNSKGHQ